VDTWRAVNGRSGLEGVSVKGLRQETQENMWLEKGAGVHVKSRGEEEAAAADQEINRR
jgi:hypothetical protein